MPSDRFWLLALLSPFNQSEAELSLGAGGGVTVRSVTKIDFEGTSIRVCFLITGEETKETWNGGKECLLMANANR